MKPSGIPKLCEKTAPRNALIAACSASLIALPEEVAATSSTMFAPGATACAYWTSRLVSIDQPNTSCLGFDVIGTCGHVDESNGVGLFPQKIVNDGGAGIRNAVSNRARSFATVALPNASTITIVCPEPSSVDVD